MQASAFKVEPSPPAQTAIVEHRADLLVPFATLQ
jgi:hypothetical protein